MKKFKTTANLAGLITIIIAVAQWAIAQAEPIAALLLSLGVPPETLEIIQTILILILTLAGAGTAYQVKARGVWSK